MQTGFSELLERYRVAAGSAQKKLAERAGFGTHGISDLERGARGLPSRFCAALAVASKSDDGPSTTSTADAP